MEVLYLMINFHSHRKVLYYRSDILDYIRQGFNSISLLTLNYHRPPLDSCGFEELDKNKFDVDCNVIDGVKVELRGVSINLNYLSECEIKGLIKFSKKLINNIPWPSLT